MNTNEKDGKTLYRFLKERSMKRMNANNNRKTVVKKILGKALLLFVLVFSVITYKYYKGNDPLQPQIAAKILRFHVLANSDSPKDQAIKLKVRDAVGGYIEPMLSDSLSLMQTKEIVSANLEGVIKTAEKVLEEEGVDYGAKAYLTRAQFPIKTYGEYTFPAGKYEALRVVLGNGEGHNWWCVLYPNMCFRGSVYEVVGKEAEEQLQEVLDPEEYADILEGGHYQVRFKFLELFQ